MNVAERIKKYGDKCLITSKEAGEYLRVSDQWMRMSRMKNAKWNGPNYIQFSVAAVRYRISDLDKYVQHRVRKTKAD